VADGCIPRGSLGYKARVFSPNLTHRLPLARPRKLSLDLTSHYSRLSHVLATKRSDRMPDVVRPPTAAHELMTSTRFGVVTFDSLSPHRARCPPSITMKQTYGSCSTPNLAPVRQSPPSTHLVPHRSGTREANSTSSHVTLHQPVVDRSLDAIVPTVPATIDTA
jgi:hypothetical protein